MSGRAFGSPGRHIQRKGEFDRLRAHIAPLGHKVLALVDARHGFFHGEKVAFGTLCLLMLEGRPLRDLAAATPADIERVAEAALLPGSPTRNVPVELTVPLVRDAILALDAFTASLTDADDGHQ